MQKRNAINQATDLFIEEMDATKSNKELAEVIAAEARRLDAMCFALGVPVEAEMT